MATTSFSQGLELSLWVCTCFLIPQVVRGVAWYCSSEEPAASSGGNYHCTKDRDPGLGVMQMYVSGGYMKRVEVFWNWRVVAQHCEYT